MKKIIITITTFFTLMTLALAACAPQPESSPSNVNQAEGLRVLAANSFLADIAQNVAGERVTVDSLIPIGIDPHAFEPTPQDVAKIAESQVLIVNGAGFEEWLAETIANAGGERLVLEASAGLTMREPTASESSHEHEAETAADDHSVESHSAMVCEQLDGKTAEEEIASGADAASAVELHSAEEHAAAEHAHEREILTLKLNPQADGTFAGFVLFDAEAEEGYAFTAGSGTIKISNAQGEALEAAQTLALECGGMSQGVIFKLAAGEYTVEFSGSANATSLFSAGPVHSEHAHSHEGDPHFWLDPNQVMMYVENIRAGLSQADPAGAETYAKNAETYLAELKTLDGWMREQVEQIPAERRILVTDHDTLGYFADQYGFSVIGAIIPSFSTGASPSAQELAQLIDQIKTTGAPAIFLDVATNPKLAEQIASETGVKVVADLYTHSVTEASGPAPSYVEMMRQNTTKIVDALK
jgi:ABC-type Zn uptake system ZnuABC Zn-binding protein ZnuA